jgi:hypothetical protein
MNHTPAYILRQYLVSQGLLSLPSAGGSWPAWVSFLPDGPDVPDEALALYDGPPFVDAREMRAHLVIQHPGILFRLRGRDYAGGWLKLYDILLALAQVVRVTVVIGASSYLLQSVDILSGVVATGRDSDTQRNEFEMTVNVTVSQL